MRERALGVGLVLLVGVAVTSAGQGGMSDDAGRVLALETAWNHAIETKDTKAIDMILADAMRLGVLERLSRNDSVKPPTRD